MVEVPSEVFDGSYTPAKLYSHLNTSAVSECPNSYK
jgi:hypothetical protein